MNDDLHLNSSSTTFSSFQQRRRLEAKVPTFQSQIPSSPLHLHLQFFSPKTSSYHQGPKKVRILRFHSFSLIFFLSFYCYFGLICVLDLGLVFFIGMGFLGICNSVWVLRKLSFGLEIHPLLQYFQFLHLGFWCLSV